MADSYKAGAKYRPAGMMFGINLADLFGDEDKEGTTTQGFEGFAPLTKTTTFNKGRTPTTLTYKAPSQPASVTEVIGAAIGTPSAPTAPEEVKEPEVSLVDDYLVNFAKYDVGEQGLFGGKDVDYLRSQGVSDVDIRKIADQRSSVQPLPAAVYQRLGGVTPAEQSTPSSPGAQTAAANRDRTRWE